MDSTQPNTTAIGAMNANKVIRCAIAAYFNGWTWREYPAYEYGADNDSIRGIEHAELSKETA